MAKYGMSMCVLGMSEEFKGDGIAVNALWSRTGMLANVLYVEYLYKDSILPTLCFTKSCFFNSQSIL